VPWLSSLVLVWLLVARASQCRSLHLTDRIPILPASLRQLANAQRESSPPKFGRTAPTTRQRPQAVPQSTVPIDRPAPPHRPPGLKRRPKKGSFRKSLNKLMVSFRGVSTFRYEAPDMNGDREDQGVKVSREILKIFDSCKIGKAVAVRAGFERIF